MGVDAFDVFGVVGVGLGEFGFEGGELAVEVGVFLGEFFVLGGCGEEAVLEVVDSGVGDVGFGAGGWGVGWFGEFLGCVWVVVSGVELRWVVWGGSLLTGAAGFVFAQEGFGGPFVYSF